MWRLDRSHYAHPVPRLYAELFPAGIRSGSHASYRRYGLPTDGLACQFVHGFGYLQSTVVSNDVEIRHRAAQAEETFGRSRWREDVQRWRETTLPRAVRAHLALAEVDAARLSGEEAAGHLRACMTHFRAMAAQHHEFNPTVVVPVGDFVAHTCDWTGCAAVDAFAVLAGNAPVSRGASTVAVEAARAVQEDAAGRALLATETADPAALLRELAALGGGVGAKVEEFLAQEGHRVVGGFDISCPTALEVPQVLVAMLRDLAGERSPVSNHAAIAQLRDAVPSPQRATFDAMLADAVLAFPLRDERGIYSDTWAAGILRRSVLALGARLAGAGIVDAPEHVMDATPDELVAVASGAPGVSGDELAARAADREAVATEQPPAVLGDPGSSPQPEIDLEALPPSLQRMWRALRALGAPPPAPVPLSGSGIGTRPYEGRARVVKDLADLWRTEPGDVLVAVTTTESLNIVGALLGALVTDVGGPFSHAAITAREWGIPAVIGCVGATARIPDGATVRVDPVAGEVSVLPDGDDLTT